MIETVGEWCSDCVGDPHAMMQLEADYAAKGVVDLEIILEQAIGVAPTMADLDHWSNSYFVTGTLLIDDQRAFERAADIIAFPTYFIVDAATMQIVTRSNDPLVAGPLGPTLDALLSNG